MDPTVFRISRSQDHIIRVVNPNPNPNIDGNFTTSKIINGNIVNLSSETSVIIKNVDFNRSSY